MPKYSCYSICIILLFASKMFGQKKTLQTQFTDEKISIDGKFDEKAWKSAQIATDFVMYAPYNGVPIPPEKKTEVKIVYTNEAIYVAASLYDDQPSEISRELTERDNFATADHFGVQLNGYNDGQQEFRFFVSAAGVQIDVFYTEANGEDVSWNAIWESKTQLTNFGWVVEMRIPYAALRFSTEKKQTWGLNFYREIRRDNQQYNWNLIRNEISSESNQAGILEGIENIKTPTRLFLIPFSSYYLHANKNQKTYGELKGGLDIKYGINDAFTLDAILIPDFGQTKFDNVELNLSAFEQQFAENRPFFTEGTDLFNKGDLLYTRRIGESPSIALADNETVDVYPNTIKLINALKVSGRTKGGLGIGVLNAVTEQTSVEVKNTDTNQTRLETLAPVTNYNVFVLDQRFNKNSSVSLTNTNVTRNGDFRDANVAALAWDLKTTANTFQMLGNFQYSLINDVEDTNGFKSYLEFNKTKGKYRYGIGGSYVSRDYDNNDLGINFQTHYHSFYGNVSYRILKPNKTFNSFKLSLNAASDYENDTGKTQNNYLNIGLNTYNTKNDYFGYGVNSRPFKVYDFYEPRSADDSKFVIYPEFYETWFFYSSNYIRKFAIDFNPTITFLNEKDRMNYGVFISPRYRFSDHLSLIYSFKFSRQNRNIGWVDFDDDGNTIFARRNRITYINTLQGKYSLNANMNLNLTVRHYWSYAVNHDYLTLQDDGTLTDNLIYNTNKNSNLNTWNLDLSYSWWFAPGSQVSVLYRNSSSLFSREYSRQFGSNFRDAINNENLSHVLSISVRYFIDYNTLKNSKFSKSFTKPKERIHF
ncbi:hypothetical protein GS03_00230 [Flavobacterium sangjuense]|uniref:Uncharacterized protein n=2 Tax=Flavobacterium sangjuense TaxID=2518177 RepID=A0A4P7PRH5_9FLAO|nr:hypothetical protein GS03_00230 [Flavobacterium sangjuense]